MGITWDEIEIDGFGIGTVRWGPMFQPHETAGYLMIELDDDDRYSVRWEEIDTAVKFVEWLQYPARRCFRGPGTQLDDFLAVWFRVWEWKRTTNKPEAQ